MAVYLSPVGLSAAQVPNRVSLLATYKERLCRRICENSTNQPEASCLRAAYKVANDPDGYEGMIFCRWTADAIGKAIKLDWEKFV